MRFICSTNRGIIDKSFNRNADISMWKNVELSTEELKHNLADGFAFCPVVWKDPAAGRSEDNYSTNQILAIDIDNDISINGQKRKKLDEEGYFSFDDACNDRMIRQNSVMIYTTSSHTDDHNRFRIIFSFNKSQSSKVFYQDTLRMLIRKYDADPNCSDIVRLFYGSSNGKFRIFNNIMSKDFLEMLKHSDRFEKRNSAEYTKKSGRLIDPAQIEDILNTIPPNPGYDVWLKILSGIGNHLEDDEITTELIDNWSPDKNQGTNYKVKHRLRKIGIGTVIYYARMYGYDISTLPGLEELTEKYHELTEMGNALRIYDEWRDILAYNHTRDKWMIWNGRYWSIDETCEHEQLAKRTIRNIIKIEAKKEKNEEKKKKILNWGKNSQKRSIFTASLKFARTETDFVTVEKHYNRNNNLFNLANGTYDLKNQRFKDHNRKDYITKFVDVEYKPEEDDGISWALFLDTIFDGNIELIDFVQRAVGYSMSGNISHEVLFFCHGKGNNGKSIFFNVLDHMFGTYGVKMDASTLMQKKQDSASNDLARLVGRRFAVSSEIEENKRLNESRVKNLTGHDKISARFLYQEHFEFVPVLKLWMYGNHKPVIRGTDDGIWRRIMLIPFNVSIPKEEQRPADELLEELLSEESQILNWMLDGYKKYKAVGLNPPRIVKMATDEYKNDSDQLMEFIEQICNTDDTTKCIKVATLFKVYQFWCKNNSEFCIGKKTFVSRIEEKGFPKKKGAHNYPEFKGISIRQEVIDQMNQQSDKNNDDKLKF